MTLHASAPEGVVCDLGAGHIRHQHRASVGQESRFCCKKGGGGTCHLLRAFLFLYLSSPSSLAPLFAGRSGSCGLHKCACLRFEEKVYEQPVRSAISVQDEVYMKRGNKRRGRQTWIGLGVVEHAKDTTTLKCGQPRNGSRSCLAAGVGEQQRKIAPLQDTMTQFMPSRNVLLNARARVQGQWGAGLLLQGPLQCCNPTLFPAMLSTSHSLTLGDVHVEKCADSETSS